MHCLKARKKPGITTTVNSDLLYFTTLIRVIRQPELESYHMSGAAGTLHGHKICIEPDVNEQLQRQMFTDFECLLTPQQASATWCGLLICMCAIRLHLFRAAKSATATYQEELFLRGLVSDSSSNQRAGKRMSRSESLEAFLSKPSLHTSSDIKIYHLSKGHSVRPSYALAPPGLNAL